MSSPSITPTQPASPAKPGAKAPSAGGVSRWPDYIATVIYLVTLLGTAGLSLASGKGFTAFLDAGLFLTAGLFGFTAFRHGILHELRWFIKMGSAVALGLFSRAQVGSLLGLSGIGGMLVGFYLTFIVTYLVAGFLLNRLAPDGPPTLAGRWSGMVFGVLEGGLLFSLLLYLLPFAAPASTTGDNLDSLGSKLAEACMAPISRRIASTPLVLLEIAREARRGIDPQKIDHQTLAKQFEPIRNNPKIRAIAEDPELSALLSAKDIKGVLRHPKVIALYSDPEVQKLGSTIDWPTVAKAIRQGIPAAGTRLPMPAEAPPDLDDATSKPPSRTPDFR